MMSKARCPHCGAEQEVATEAGSAEGLPPPIPLPLHPIPLVSPDVAADWLLAIRKGMVIHLTVLLCAALVMTAEYVLALLWAPGYLPWAGEATGLIAVAAAVWAAWLISRPDPSDSSWQKVGRLFIRSGAVLAVVWAIPWQLWEDVSLPVPTLIALDIALYAAVLFAGVSNILFFAYLRSLSRRMNDERLAGSFHFIACQLIVVFILAAAGGMVHLIAFEEGGFLRIFAFRPAVPQTAPSAKIPWALMGFCFTCVAGIWGYVASRYWLLARRLRSAARGVRVMEVEAGRSPAGN